VGDGAESESKPGPESTIFEKRERQTRGVCAVKKNIWGGGGKIPLGKKRIGRGKSRKKGSQKNGNSHSIP